MNGSKRYPVHFGEENLSSRKGRYGEVWGGMGRGNSYWKGGYSRVWHPVARKKAPLWWLFGRTATS